LHQKVEHLLECLLKTGGGAAATDVSKSAVEAEEATAFARDAALSLQKSASRLVELAEAPVPVTKAAAEMARTRDKMASDLAIGSAEDTKEGAEEKEEELRTKTHDPEKTKATVQTAIDQLTALEEEAQEFAKLQVEFDLQAKMAKLSVQAFMKSMDMASHFNEGGDTPN
jgi:hypothetical protein